MSTKEVNCGGNGRLHQSRVEAMSAEEKQDASFNADKQLYAEQFGDSIVTFPLWLRTSIGGC
jgi:hypothetical protein